jgi:hypothetical protein
VTGTNDQDPIRASRLARLRVELVEECNGLTLSEAALEEVQHCRWMEAHEGRRPSYGAIVAPAPVDDLGFAGAIELPNAAAVTVGNTSLSQGTGRLSVSLRPGGVTAGRTPHASCSSALQIPQANSRMSRVPWNFGGGPFMSSGGDALILA